jgi:hypothetical protein
MIRRFGDAMCGLHRACGDEECGFLGSASKPWSTLCQWFGLKTTVTVYEWVCLKITRTVFSGLTLKLMTTVFSGLTSKPIATVSLGLASKPVVSFLVEPQNQCGRGFSGLGVQTDSYSLVICDLKSP